MANTYNNYQATYNTQSAAHAEAQKWALASALEKLAHDTCMRMIGNI